MTLILFLLAGFFSTVAFIKLFLQWLKRKHIFDIPNERSSHQTPTPVGGGLVIVFVSLGLYFTYLVLNESDFPWSYIVGALLVATISWLDDLYSIPVGIRFLVHSLAALIIIFGSNVSGNLSIPFLGNLELGWLGYLVWFLWIVWLINAYNFMDGIDGIAGLQAIIAGIGWATIGFLQGIPDIGFLGAIVAASCSGFLIFNWQPAKLFMGDVGSAFLGFTFAVFPLILEKKTVGGAGNFFVVAILLVWIFVFDSVLTLLRRLFNGEHIWKAHRKHLYQQLIIKGFSHQTVSLIYGVLAILISIVTVLKIHQNTPYDFMLLFFTLILSASLAFFSFLK